MRQKNSWDFNNSPPQKKGESFAQPVLKIIQSRILLNLKPKK